MGERVRYMIEMLGMRLQLGVLWLVYARPPSFLFIRIYPYLERDLLPLVSGFLMFHVHSSRPLLADAKK